MLIRYNFENFMSVGDQTELTMIPDLTRSHPTHKMRFEDRNLRELLKLGIIYGANASGKSNIIKSLQFMQDFIVEGTKPDNNIPIPKHKLSSNFVKSPSRFEVEFRINDKNYGYGFLVSNIMVIEEWLVEIGATRDKIIFERYELKDEEKRYKFDKIKFASAKEKTFLDFVAKGTRENQLFLTECNQRNVLKNVKGALPIMEALDWFKNRLTIIFPDSKFGGLNIELEKNEDFKNELTKYLKIFDTGIDGVELVEIDFDSMRELPEEIKVEIKNEIKENAGFIITDTFSNTFSFKKNKNGSISAAKVMTKHKLSNSGKYVNFELNEESDGTQRLIDLIPALLELSRKDKVYLIDEIDRSLHPSISKEFLKLFFELSKNRASQLIATTHDISLLDLGCFRKDEIWFVEKDKNNQSKLFSLQEFNPRFDKRIRNDYLLGRFGAIPKLKNFIY